ncbi:MAG: bifunctional nuclease family protein [Flavobacteriia bacterium]|nr:bifunctional nuclease family protein [Flavobacteriia bacterium]
MNKIPLTIKGLSYSERQTGAYALILAEENGARKLPIVIGGFEAQAIAIALEKMVSPPRPLTHDLFRDFAQVFDIGLTEIIIYKIKDGVFYANLHCLKDGKEEVLDARPSDAVALAIRFQCPIFTTEEVLQSAGLILKEEADEAQSTSTEPTDTPLSENKSSDSDNPLKSSSLAQLNEMLDKAVKNEDYELAARIRDEIDRRES